MKDILFLFKRYCRVNDCCPLIRKASVRIEPPPCRRRGRNGHNAGLDNNAGPLAAVAVRDDGRKATTKPPPKKVTQLQ
eukprot:1535161-Pyramimonas_sp.AAC.1